jgi:hypothetical protein
MDVSTIKGNVTLEDEGHFKNEVDEAKQRNKARKAEMSIMSSTGAHQPKRIRQVGTINETMESRSISDSKILSVRLDSFSIGTWLKS